MKIKTALKISSGHLLEFEIGQTVFLKTDREQRERLVTGIKLRPFNCVTYDLSYETSETTHYGIEMDSVRDIIKATT